MINYNDLLKLNPFGLKKRKKDTLFFWHKKNCQFFITKILKNIKIIDFKFSHFKKVKKLEMLPFLHSKIFKSYDLKSTNNNLKVLILQAQVIQSYRK